MTIQNNGAKIIYCHHRMHLDVQYTCTGALPLTQMIKTRQQIENTLLPRDQDVIATSEFNEVKARLAVPENWRQLTDDTKEVRPTLRGVPRTAWDETSDDDRPTLKRHDNLIGASTEMRFGCGPPRTRTLRHANGEKKEDFDS